MFQIKFYIQKNLLIMYFFYSIHSDEKELLSDLPVLYQN